MNRHSQKGSALLIVLGFLSFMVVSAVAFAIWMRTERLPSSALRRTVANRYLVKAALAQAMSRVDDAIRSHAYPGAWYTNKQNEVYCDKNSCAYDWWEARVFMPPDPWGRETSSGKPNSRYAPAAKTVSVLNLEALGYLPPSIVNDVRFLSRASWAAQWDYFNFDAGRYAFCAVNVSDMLDITKMAADSPRTSAAAMRTQKPGEKPLPSRFSLAYLFRNDDNGHTNPNGGALALFDDRVHLKPGNGEWNAVPLVSLLDYNVSIANNSSGKFYSPFYKWLGFNNSQYFYDGVNVKEADEVKGAKRQPFITTSWFPSNNLVRCGRKRDTPLDISQEPNWPFPRKLLQNEKANLDDVLMESTEELFWKPMTDVRHAFCVLDRFSLFDYLDENDIPLSLAIPCVERVPMLTALGPLSSSSVNMEFVNSASPEDEPDPVKGADYKRKVYKTNLKVKLGGMGMYSTVIYPFSGGDTPGTFTTEAFARLIFVGEEGAAADAEAAVPPRVSLRNNGLAKNCRPTTKEWNKNDKDKPFSVDGANQNALFITLPLQDPQSWKPDRDMVNNCWSPRQVLTFQDVGTQLPAEGITILRRIQYYLIKKDDRGNVIDEVPDPDRKEPFYEITLRPFGENGELISKEAIPEGEMSEETFKGIYEKYKIRPYLVVWARVKNEKDDTVDMVPATFEDDQTYNSINNKDFADNAGDMGYALGYNAQQTGSSHNMPIMRFPGKQFFTYKHVQEGTTVACNDWYDKSCYAVDPRYNWAPENWWFDKDNYEPNGQMWHDEVFRDGGIIDQLVKYEFGGGLGRGDRANDPFMFVSDLGYLQSVGELAFLPHLSNMSENGTPTSVLGDPKEHARGGNTPLGSLYNGKPRYLEDFSDASSDKTIPCALAAWKCYQNYRTNRNGFEFGANLYRRGLVNGAQGFYVNPYTQSREVLLAALANPPLNYWAAGENYDWKTGELNKEHPTFSEWQDRRFHGGSKPALSGEDISKIARFLHRRFEDLAGMIEFPKEMTAQDLYAYQKVWEDLFDALDWNGTLDCSIEEVYNKLQDYYAEVGTSNSSTGYSDTYMQKRGYKFLNQYAQGGDKRGFSTRINLNPSKAVHWEEDRALKADPLRGQGPAESDGAPAGDTSCWQNLRDVDRMFLHSYWRDCFANRQQLFLIFVRAESTALGGAGEGTPAQQGGRAVALVWRDPLPTFNKKEPPDLPDLAGDFDDDSDGQNVYRDDRRPHKMRVLFYRQFD